MPFRYRVRLLVCGFACFLAGCAAHGAEAFLQYHCAGAPQLVADARLASLHKALSAASATNIESLALTRLSGNVSELLPIEKPGEAAALLRPLVSDLLLTESAGLVFGETTQSASFAFAVRLAPEKSRAWQEAFARIFGGTGESFSVQDYTGLKWKAKGDSFWSLVAGEWILVGFGADSIEKQSAYAAKIKESGRPFPELKEHWLEMEADTGRLDGWFSLMKPARANLNISIGEDVLEISAKVREQQQAAWQSAAWHVPTSLVRGKVVSFVAGQNVEAFLNLGREFSQLPYAPLTNQFYVWAGEQMPFVDYMAWPAADATNAIRSIRTNWPTILNPLLKQYNGSELTTQLSGERLAWAKMRIFSPVLYATEDKGKPFLLASGFPMPAVSSSVPDALVAQVEGSTNLVYYDWEMTGKRLAEWVILDKMIANRAEGPTEEDATASAHEVTWLNRVSGIPGRSVTEIKLTAPNELTITRSASIGLTAFELVKFTDWICNANAGPINSAPPPGMPLPMAPHP